MGSGWLTFDERVELVKKKNPSGSGAKGVESEARASDQKRPGMFSKVRGRFGRSSSYNCSSDHDKDL